MALFAPWHTQNALQMREGTGYWQHIHCKTPCYIIITNSRVQHTIIANVELLHANIHLNQ